MNATPEFYTIKQRYTLGVNRYEIRRTGEDFEGGELIAFAQQKRMKLKEEIAGAIAAATRADPTIAPDAMRRIMGEDRFRQGLEWHGYYEGEEDPITGVVTFKVNKQPELDTPF